MSKRASKRVNKSAAIRELKAKHPEMKPREIAEKIPGVTSAYVSLVLWGAKKKGSIEERKVPTTPKPAKVARKSRKKAGVSVGTWTFPNADIAAKADPGAMTVEDLLATKAFVDKVGGTDRAGALLRSLQSLLA